MRRIRSTRLPFFIAWMTILGAMAWLGTHPRLVAPFASNLINRQLMHGMGGSFRLQDFHFRVFEGVDLYGVSLNLPGLEDGMTLVSADTVIVDFSLREILSDTPRLQRVIINRPEVYSRIGKGKGDPSEANSSSDQGQGFAPLAIDNLEITQAFVELSGSDGRLIERFSHVDWRGRFHSGSQIHLQLHGCDLAWDTHQSLITEIRGDVIIDYREISIPRAYGFLNGRPVEVGGFRQWDGLLDIAVDCQDVSIAQTENLIDMTIGFNARGDLQATFFASGDSVLYSGLFNGELEGYEMRDLVGQAVIADDKVIVSGVSGWINEAWFEGGGVFHVPNEQELSFVLEGDVRDVDLAKDLVPDVADLPRTDGYGRLKIEHTMQPLWTRVSGALHDGFIDVLPFDSCTVDVVAFADSLVFNRIDLTHGDLHAVLTGDTDRDQVFRGQLMTQALDLATLPAQWNLPPFSGWASAWGELAGPLDDLTFSGLVNVYDFTIANGAFTTAEGVVTIDDVLEEPLVTATIEGGGLALGGVGLGEFRVNGRASSRFAEVDSFRSILGDTTSALAFRVDFGDSVQQFGFDRFTVSLEGTRWAMAEPSTFSIGPGKFSMPDLQIASNQGTLTASGFYEKGQKVRGNLKMRGFDLGLLDPFVFNSEPLSGRLTADVLIGGDPENPVVVLTGDLMDAPFSLANIDSLHLAASFSQGTLEFEDLDLLTNFGRVRGRGSITHQGVGFKDFWPGAELDANLQVFDGDWKFMEQFALPALDRLAGSFNGNLQLTGSTDDPLISGALNSAPFNIHWLHLDQLEGQVWADRSSLVLGDLCGRKDDLDLTGRIELPLELDFLHVPVAPLDGPFYMQLSVPSESNLEPLSRATNAFVQTSGTGWGDVVISGPLDHPLYQGQVFLEDVGFVLRDMEEVYEGISATGFFEGDKLQINDIKGNEGLKGTLQGHGTLTFQGLLLKGFDVQLDLDRFLVASVPDLRVLVSGPGARISSVYVGPDSLLVPKFSGTLEVIKGRYTGDFTEKPGATDPLQATVAPDWLADLKLHADPRTARILNRELELFMGGDLDLIRDLEGLYLRGSLDVNAGRLIVFNNTFNVERGLLDFSREVGFDPRIDVDAVTKHRLQSRFLENSSVIENISVHVGGTLAKPEVSFSSDQGYSREAIQRMLLGLDPYPDVTGGDVAQLGASSITAGFNLLEREIAPKLSVFDTFEIEQIRRQWETGESGFDPVLFGFGKYIGPSLYLKVAAGVRRDDHDIVVEYQFNRHLLLQSEIRRRIDESQGRETYNLDLKYRFEY
ncbi:MAG: translocation/assembly module TamB [Gemmatimonadales bacterium]|nr:translocation/assembly module TamB [Gemmatimonadales bacterium]